MDHGDGGDGDERKVRQKGDDEQECQESDEGKKEKKQPTVSDKYNSEDADIRLITSDNVLFKVHSYQLMAASYVQ